MLWIYHRDPAVPLLQLVAEAFECFATSDILSHPKFSSEGTIDSPRIAFTAFEKAVFQAQQCAIWSAGPRLLWRTWSAHLKGGPMVFAAS